MKIRSITLGNVRRFQGQQARLDNLGDGVTTICAPNESGKSTFFDALHSLLFVDHKSSAAEVKSLQPHAGGAVRIAAEIELVDGLYRIEKTFLARKGAKVTEVSNNRVIGLEGEAERWIKEQICDTAMGPAGLLWVRQGVPGFGPDGGGQKEKNERERLRDARRDLMSSVAGQIDAVTGGRRMDQIMSRCREAHDQLATTQNRPKAGGPWARQDKAVQELEEERDRLAGMVSDLSQALKTKTQLERDLATIADPEEAKRREQELLDARRDLEKAKALSGEIEAAARDLRLLELERAQIEGDIAQLEERAEARAALTRQIAELKDREEDLGKQVAAAKTRREDASEDLKTKTSQKTQVQDELRAARKSAQLSAAIAALRQLRARIGRAKKSEADLETAEGVLRASAPDAAALEEMEGLDRLIATAEAALRRSAASVEVSYDADATLAWGDGMAIEADSRHEILVDRSILVPGVARLTLRPGSGADKLEEQIRTDRETLEETLSRYDLPTIDAARTARLAYQDADRAKTSANAAIEAIAPEGIEALKTEERRLLGELADHGLSVKDIAAISEAETPGQDASADIPSLEARLDRAEEDVSTARSTQDDALEALRTLERGLGEASTERRLAEESLVRLGAAACDAQTKAEQSRLLEEKRAAEKKQGARLDELREDAPDAELLGTQVERLENAQKSIAAERQRLSGEIKQIEGTIRARAEDGVEEKLSEVEGRLEAARLRSDRYRREALALSELLSQLEAARQSARDAYFEPVKREIKPLLRMLHSGADLDMDGETMLVSRLKRDGVEDDLDVLSGGAFEQVAILTRLAFARLYAKQDRHVPVILDDALVHSDDKRIGTMFTLLTHVGKTQQILVFSCRTRAFADLGGQRGSIEISDLPD